MNDGLTEGLNKAGFKSKNNNNQNNNNYSIPKYDFTSYEENIKNRNNLLKQFKLRLLKSHALIVYREVNKMNNEFKKYKDKKELTLKLDEIIAACEQKKKRLRNEAVMFEISISLLNDLNTFIINKNKEEIETILEKLTIFFKTFYFLSLSEEEIKNLKNPRKNKGGRNGNYKKRN